MDAQGTSLLKFCAHFLFQIGAAGWELSYLLSQRHQTSNAQRTTKNDPEDTQPVSLATCHLTFNLGRV